MLLEIGFIKTAVGLDQFAGPTRFALSKKYSGSKSSKAASLPKVDLSSMIPSKKDNPPLWQEGVAKVTKDMQRHQNLKGSLSTYWTDKVKAIKNITSTPEKALTTAAGTAGYFASRNNPKLAPIIQSFVNKKVTYNKKQQKGHTNASYSFPKRKGDWGKFTFSKSF
ncbi:MAG: hypothetical protein H8E12_16800 [Rhodobacteraceae bacterium]|nr:hypothetical protein [Paracoccaceae bacterium]